MHGVCFDFFFVTGQLYTDQEAPAHLRSTAQGFITVVTYGFGMLVGSFLSGYALDYFTTTNAGARDGQRLGAFWFSSAAMSAVIGLLVLFFFRSRAGSPRSRPRRRRPERIEPDVKSINPAPARSRSVRAARRRGDRSAASRARRRRSGRGGAPRSTSAAG